MCWNKSLPLQVLLGKMDKSSEMYVIIYDNIIWREKKRGFRL